MGTLYDQPVRKWNNIEVRDILNFATELKEISTKTNLSVDQIIKIYEIKELERKNNLFVINGDIHDEQMSGFGELFKKAIISMDNLSEALGNK